jgi:hypothetical protein
VKRPRRRGTPPRVVRVARAPPPACQRPYRSRGDATHPPGKEPRPPTLSPFGGSPHARQVKKPRLSATDTLTECGPMCAQRHLCEGRDCSSIATDSVNKTGCRSRFLSVPHRPPLRSPPLLRAGRSDLPAASVAQSSAALPDLRRPPSAERRVNAASSEFLTQNGTAFGVLLPCTSSFARGGLASHEIQVFAAFHHCSPTRCTRLSARR